MEPQPGSTQDRVAIDDDQRQVIADIGTRALSAQERWAFAYDFDVSHDRERRHYGAVRNEYEIGRLDCTLTGHRVVLPSTVIASRFQQRRIATELIRRVSLCSINMGSLVGLTR